MKFGVARNKLDFSNFGSLKSTETGSAAPKEATAMDFSNFGSLKSTETGDSETGTGKDEKISAISAR